MTGEVFSFGVSIGVTAEFSIHVLLWGFCFFLFPLSVLLLVLFAFLPLLW